MEPACNPYTLEMEAEGHTQALWLHTELQASLETLDT